jgi:hypothetical protein
LPSPPATNSTGSGSTGDPASIAVRGGRLNMLNGTNIKTFHAAFSSASAAAAADDEQDDYDNDNDDGDGEDNTARLDQQRRHSASENVLALQRVKSLTQRNKMVRFPLLLALESFLTVFGLFSFIHPIHTWVAPTFAARKPTTNTGLTTVSTFWAHISTFFAHISTLRDTCSAIRTYAHTPSPPLGPAVPVSTYLLIIVCFSRRSDAFAGYVLLPITWPTDRLPNILPIYTTPLNLCPRHFASSCFYFYSTPALIRFPDCPDFARIGLR